MVGVLLLAVTLSGVSASFVDAARDGRYDDARALLARGARVDARSEEDRKMTALMYAARAARSDVVGWLLAAKADVRLADSDGKTPLDHVLSEPQVFAERRDTRPPNDVARTVEALLKAGASPTPKRKESLPQPLEAAAALGNAWAVDLLLLAGADVRAPSGGCNAVMAARDSLEILQRFLSRAPECTRPEGWSVTLLEHVAEYRDRDVIRLVLEKMKAPTRAELSGAMRAYVQGGGLDQKRAADPSFVEELTKKGADLTAVGSRGDGVLTAAIWADDGAMFDWLTARGARVDKECAALVDAVVSLKRLSFGKRIVDAGCRPDKTAGAALLRDEAAEGNTEGVAWLLDHGIDVDAADGAGSTALLRAAMQDKDATVKLLLARGADPTRVWGGMTARERLLEDRPEAQGTIQLLRAAELARIAATEPSEVIILTGGKDSAEALAALERFKRLQLAREAIQPSEGYPKVVKSDDIAGLNPGFQIAVLGFCPSSEAEELVEEARLIFPGAYARKVASGDKGGCPTRNLRGPVFEERSVRGPEGRVMRGAAADGETWAGVFVSLTRAHAELDFQEIVLEGYPRPGVMGRCETSLTEKGGAVVVRQRCSGLFYDNCNWPDRSSTWRLTIDGDRIAVSHSEPPPPKPIRCAE